MNSPQGKVFFLGVICFFVIPVKPGVWFGLGILLSSFFFDLQTLSNAIPDKLVKKNLQSSTILNSMSFLLMIGTYSPLVALLRVPSQRVGLLKVCLISNLGKELVD